MKKIAAFITSFALLANISAVNAAAGYEPAAAASLLAEHGYEQYKDTFYYVSNSSGGKMFDVIECYDFNYNNLEVDLIDWSEWDNVFMRNTLLSLILMQRMMVYICMTELTRAMTR